MYQRVLARALVVTVATQNSLLVIIKSQLWQFCHHRAPFSRRPVVTQHYRYCLLAATRGIDDHRMVLNRIPRAGIVFPTSMLFDNTSNQLSTVIIQRLLELHRNNLFHDIQRTPMHNIKYDVAYGQDKKNKTPTARRIGRADRPRDDTPSRGGQQFSGLWCKLELPARIQKWSRHRKRVLVYCTYTPGVARCTGRTKQHSMDGSIEHKGSYWIQLIGKVDFDLVVKC